MNIFKGLNEAEIKSVIHDPRCYENHYLPGDVIYSSDNFNKAVGIIKSGSAVVHSSFNGGVKIRYLSENDCFGVAAVFSDDNRYVSVIRAETECDIIYIAEEVVRDAVNKIPNFAVNYIEFLTGRIKYLNILVDAYSSPNVETRLARYIVAYVDGREVPFDYNMSDLSKTLGIGRASLYRALDVLESLNLIERDGKRMIIKDLPGLKKYC